MLTIQLMFHSTRSTKNGSQFFLIEIKSLYLKQLVNEKVKKNKNIESLILNLVIVGWK